MAFSVVPVIDVMLALYGQPRGYDRFREYLQLLQGDTRGDMVLPIGYYNPMAREHVAGKLNELKQLNAEATMADTANSFPLATGTDKPYKLVLNLADDLMGGWTNRYTTDYQAKFRAQALMKRGFCTPLFWTSEQYTKELICRRTMAYIARTIWMQQNGKPQTLEDHVMQEQFVAAHTHAAPSGNTDPSVAQFYTSHAQSIDDSVIFNFMYGDEAAAQLAYPTFGIAPPYAGFAFAAALK